VLLYYVIKSLYCRTPADRVAVLSHSLLYMIKSLSLLLRRWCDTTPFPAALILTSSANDGPQILDGPPPISELQPASQLQQLRDASRPEPTQTSYDRTPPISEPQPAPQFQQPHDASRQAQVPMPAAPEPIQPIVDESDEPQSFWQRLRKIYCCV